MLVIVISAGVDKEAVSSIYYYYFNRMTCLRIRQRVSVCVCGTIHVYHHRHHLLHTAHPTYAPFVYALYVHDNTCFTIQLYHDVDVRS